MKPLVKTISLLVFLLFLFQSCGVTRVVAEYDCDTFDNNPEYEETSVNYWWGLQQARDIDPKCCDDCAINKFEVVKQFDHFFISFITLGIVIPTRVKWCCRPPDAEIENID
ncbi:MAG: hypothetical protein AAFZ15_09485 [Bacteroidota bacterium]